MMRKGKFLEYYYIFLQTIILMLTPKLINNIIKLIKLFRIYNSIDNIDEINKKKGKQKKNGK